MWSGHSRWPPQGPCATLPLSHCTRAPKMRREQSHKELLASEATRLDGSGRLRVRALQRESSTFSYCVKVGVFSCAYSCLLCLKSLFLWKINMIGNCSGPLTSEIKASCQYFKKDRISK